MFHDRLNKKKHTESLVHNNVQFNFSPVTFFSPQTQLSFLFVNLYSFVYANMSLIYSLIAPQITNTTRCAHHKGGGGIRLLLLQVHGILHSLDNRRERWINGDPIRSSRQTLHIYRSPDRLYSLCRLSKTSRLVCACGCGSWLSLPLLRTPGRLWCNGGGCGCRPSNDNDPDDCTNPNNPSPASPGPVLPSRGIFSIPYTDAGRPFDTARFNLPTDRLPSVARPPARGMIRAGSGFPACARHAGALFDRRGWSFW